MDLDEAGMFLKRKEKSAKRCAAAIMAFILSPELLILLTAGLSESGKIGLSEDAAAGLGIIAALLIVAGGVGTLILNGIGQEQYEYLEKESFYLSYGVEGVIKKKKEDFVPVYRLGITAGVVLCILSVLPLFIGNVLLVSELTEILFLNLMIFLISLAVYLFVWIGMVQESYEMILQEGDYTKEKKEEKKKDEHYMEPISKVYWCLVTAIYLGISFYKGNWGESWIIWPCAGVLSGVVYGLAKLLKRN